MADKKVKITLTKSPIGASPNHRKIVEALRKCIRQLSNLTIRRHAEQLKK